ncbi:hypothetical protein B0G76_8419 [Paraburkholderia sp. BL23I1N1]|nr:hypothetical protein B0G76_8419 [Paraburkholderia sp. BL23I1N1]
MSRDQQTPIRPECLRPADDFWVQPTGEEVREVLRRASLTGAQAARLLGMKGATGRGIRRYTGGDAPIPYPSWAILCDVAGLGKIWGEPAMVGSEEEEDVRGGETVEWSEAKAAEFVQTLQREEAAKAFLTLWRQRCNVEDHVQVVRDVISGTTALSDAALTECRNGLMRLRQAAHALAQLASSRTWSRETDPVIGLVVQRYADLADEAEESVRTILKWAEMPARTGREPLD